MVKTPFFDTLGVSSMVEISKLVLLESELLLISSFISSKFSRVKWEFLFISCVKHLFTIFCYFLDLLLLKFVVVLVCFFIFNFWEWIFFSFLLFKSIFMGLRSFMTFVVTTDFLSLDCPLNFFLDLNGLLTCMFSFFFGLFR